jgi:hypothetical protein
MNGVSSPSDDVRTRFGSVRSLAGIRGGASGVAAIAMVAAKNR